MDVGGTPWSTNSLRRRTAPADIGTPRRRTIQYGYGGRNDLQQQYGYHFPEKTNYGYSGVGPQKNNYAKLAMAAAGGAALGVGGYYLYHQMANSNWASGVTYNDRSWCIVPEGVYQGRLIRCLDCAQRFGSRNCRSNNDCFGSGGCQYQLPSNTQRDDLMSTGFRPSHYTAPLVLTITGITGNDYQASNICPGNQPTGSYDDTWLRTSSLDVGLYVTLTEMKDFSPNSLNNGVANMSAGAAGPSWWLLLAFAALALRGVMPMPRRRRSP